MAEQRNDSNLTESNLTESKLTETTDRGGQAAVKSALSDGKSISSESVDQQIGGQWRDQDQGQGWRGTVEILLLVALFFVYSGDSPPMVNEAHYLVKAKNYWNPEWCNQDMFVASDKVHTTFYFLFGWPTKYLTLAQTAWLGRLVGWSLLAIGLQRLARVLFRRAFVSLAIAVLWIAGVEYGNLAGEWVVGGIEAKVPAYGLVLLALANLVQRRWAWVWVLLGTAAAFHVLSGGWAVVAAASCWFVTERKRPDGVKLITPALFLGGCIALLGLIPALTMSWEADAEQTAMAARIYSYYRIKHHLLPGDFYLSWYVRFLSLAALMVIGLRVYGKSEERIRILGWFALATLGISAIGLLVGVLAPYAPNLMAKLLRYYWFRLADAIVPLMVAVLVSRMLLDYRQVARFTGLALLTLAVGLCGLSAYNSTHRAVPPSVSNDLLGVDSGASAETQQQVYRDWLAVCRWARQSSDENEVFLTPRNQQTFKWFSGRAEVVNWKDVPQNPSALIQWYERFREVYPDQIGNRRTANRVSIRYPTLLGFREKYGVRYMIVDRRITGDNLPLLRIYPNEPEQNGTYAVYELPYPADESP